MKRRLRCDVCNTPIPDANIVRTTWQDGTPLMFWTCAGCPWGGWCP